MYDRKKTELYVASYVHKLCCKSRELNIWIFTVVIKECSTYPTFKAHLKQWLATRSVTTIAPFPLVTTLVNLPQLTTSQLGLDRLFSVTIEYHLMCVAVVIATSQSIPWRNLYASWMLKQRWIYMLFCLWLFLRLGDHSVVFVAFPSLSGLKNGGFDIHWEMLSWLIECCRWPANLVACSMTTSHFSTCSDLLEPF